MKQALTLIVCFCLCMYSNAQLVLNEIYTEPNSGKSEFFELYNTNGVAESTDNYTLVTYYKFSNNNKGFYILDMPAAMVAPKGYFVGSAFNPFDYQGVVHSTNTNFSWNNTTYLANNTGSLTAWKLGNNNLVDGNVYYDQVGIPGNFNDLFNRLPAAGASYILFLYKNGILVNSLLAGTGGQTGMSSEITSMPSLYVAMSGTAPGFTINFSTYNSLPVEMVIEEAGADNGYMRTTDGACGSWAKSSNGASHTPMATNGTLTAGVSGSVSIYATISRGDAASGSMVTYGVNTAPAGALPVAMSVYLDNGTVASQWDVNDSLIYTDTINAANVTKAYTFFPYNADLIIVTKAAYGCIDNVRAIANVTEMVLPVNFLSIKGYSLNKKAILEWSVAENEKIKSLEVQKSMDGVHFSTVTVFASTEKKGMESYYYRCMEELINTNYYRIKITELNNGFSYSKIISLKENDSSTSFTLLQNPVTSTLYFTYSASATNATTLNIYNTTGIKVYTTPVSMQKGLTTNSISLDSRMAAGTYIVELINSQERSVVKMMKQ